MFRTFLLWLLFGALGLLVYDAYSGAQRTPPADDAQMQVLEGGDPWPVPSPKPR